MANETIEKYLQNQLSPVERSEFEKMLMEDPSLAVQLEQEKDIHIALDLLARLKKKEEIEAISDRPANQNKRLPLYRMVAAIALVILLGGAYWLLNQTYSNKALLAGFDDRFEMDLTNRGGNFENKLADATTAYQAGLYETALTEFSSLPESMSEYWLVQVFAGNCQLELGRYDEAVKTFSQISEQSDLYGETAQWYLAIAYLGLSEEENAKRVLGQIREGEFNYSKARRLLSRLNSPFRQFPGI